MKKTLLAISCMAVLAIACEKEPATEPGDPALEGVDIEEMISKTIIAGDPAAITIKGGDFDEELDHVWLGWTEADTLALEEVDNGSLDIRRTRISFGLDCYSMAREHTVNVYLWRDGYQMLKISGDIEVKTAEVSDGFIPDKQFYADLTCKNPSVTDMTGTCGLIDVTAAKALEREPNPGEGWPFDISWATSDNFSGIELFESLGSIPANDTEIGEGMNLVAWYCPNVKELDFSNWVAPVKYRGSACKSLEKFICGPKMYGAVLEDCSNLTYVDMHLSNRATWIMLSGSSVEYLDIRHCQKGTEGVDYFANCESGSFAFGTGIKDNCLIKIDSYYLIRHFVDNAWSKIYKAWKNGATIEVYSCIEIDEKLGTVPAYADDPTALSETSWDFRDGEEEFGYSTNGWVIDDPYTDRDETARRPNA